MSPLVSTSRWCLRPLIFLPASYPRSPPCSVVLTDWLSRMPALGVGSRPCVIRTASRNVVCILSHTPVSRQLQKYVHTVDLHGKSCGNALQAHPPRTRYKMALSISRIFCVRG